MTVVIMHPSDELFFADLQKELICTLYEKNRIMSQTVPLWFELGDFDIAAKTQIKQVRIGELCVMPDSVYCPVLIECDGRIINSKLTLVSLFRGKDFSPEEVAALKQKPARQLKVFRLGIAQDEGPHAKSISKSVWCKLHHSRTTVE